jgi:uncharacterized membrane protein (UPF0127 family)
MRRVEAAGWALEIPESHVERTRGLLGRTELDPTDALVLARCSSVHTIGMRFPIDVIAFDEDWSVIDVRTLQPGRVSWPRRRVRHVIETAAGRGQAFNASLDGRTIRGALGTDRPRT